MNRLYHKLWAKIVFFSQLLPVLKINITFVIQSNR